MVLCKFIEFVRGRLARIGSVADAGSKPGMLTIDPRVTPELLKGAFEQVHSDIQAAKFGDPAVERICSMAKSLAFRRWALECASEVWAVKEIPEEVALTVLGLLTAGMLVGMQVQKAAAEIGALENLCADKRAPNPPQS